ncbi:RICIN domain-containing protein [Nonomuraea angiospora]|uniref:RICIN domain-containing protein n=1 Tax=Nonomuraea angiospora TaxID=46172 RepID=UPI0029BBF0BA|nr:RICIN domain-containing protein [Nonomuraea angiospora]MDX3101649.1 RICIN domain-containing protein [Nonomuraea angiospora]
MQDLLRLSGRRAPARPRSPVGAVVCVLATVLACVAAWPVPASAASALVNAASGRCLDVKGNLDTPGTALDIWDCGGGANQSFEFTPAGELRTFAGTRCVDASNGTARREAAAARSSSTRPRSYARSAGSARARSTGCPTRAPHPCRSCSR